MSHSMKKTTVALSLMISGMVVINSCKKEFDHPPFKGINDGNKVMVDLLKARTPSSGSYYRFGGGDTNLYGTVLADESSGNIYKQTFIQDDNGGAIQLNLLNTGGLAVGDRIRVNLNKIYVVNANNMIYLDSVDLGKSVVKLSSGNPVTPKVVTIGQILAGSVPTNSNSLQSQLVLIENSEFVEKGLPFADAIGKANVNRTLKACGATGSLTVRSSGYANFAAKPIPAGNGTFVAIVTQYNSTMQMTIRNYNEINMPNDGCPVIPPPPGTYLVKDFSDGSATSGGWSNQNASGNINWTAASLGSWANKPYGNCSNYNGSNVACESWLISPAIDLSGSTTPILNFMNAYNYTGPAMTLYVSTNYTSGLPNTATWTQLPFTASAGSFAFTNSGNVALSAYKTANTRIAFKYTGTNSNGSTWEVDDIVVKEQ